MEREREEEKPTSWGLGSPTSLLLSFFVFIKGSRCRYMLCCCSSCCVVI